MQSRAGQRQLCAGVAFSGFQGAAAGGPCGTDSGSPGQRGHQLPLPWHCPLTWVRVAPPGTSRKGQCLGAPRQGRGADEGVARGAGGGVGGPGPQVPPRFRFPRLCLHCAFVIIITERGVRGLVQAAVITLQTLISKKPHQGALRATVEAVGRAAARAAFPDAASGSGAGGPGGGGCPPLSVRARPLRPPGCLARGVCRWLVA